MSADRSVGAEGQSQPFRVAGWWVDPGACRIAREGEELHLEPKVMQVLVHLAERRGQVVSRQELEQLVWTGTVVGYEAVTNAVIKLRKALDDDARHPEIIETIPKRGYRLLADVAPAAPVDQAPSSRTWQGNNSLVNSNDATRRKRGWLGIAVVLLFALGGLWLLKPSQAPPGPPAEERMSLPLPDKPSIAVLPFENLTGDPRKEYMADGMSEYIISSLAKVPDVFVVARHSTFVYKDNTVEVRRVAEDLGVQYVLEGSLQASGARVRVTAQLIDALSGLHVWSEQYDRDLTDFFALQDDITRRIAVAMSAELAWGDSAYIESRSATDLKAWLLVQQALAEYRRFTPNGNRKAQELVRKALDQDPDYAQALAVMGWTHLTDARFSYSESRPESLSLAREFADKVAAIDPEHPKLLYLQAFIDLINGEPGKAIENAERLLRAAPGSAEFTAGFSVILYFAGNFERSIELMNKALRMSPRSPAWYDLYLGRAYAMNGEYDLAEREFRRVTASRTSPVITAGGHTGLAFVFIETGRHDEARAEVDKALARVNWLSLAFYEDLSHFKDRAHWQRIATALREAGLPETRG